MSNLNNYPIKGILFDVDGTLYKQFLMRTLMIVSFILTNFITPWKIISEGKIIRTYRRSLEHLRTNGKNISYNDHLKLTANNLKIPFTIVQEVVSKWMEIKPLKYIYLCRRRNLEKVINTLYQRNIKIGVYSDYPSREKLLALNILHYMSTVVCSTDSDVRSFKPSPHGFIVAAKKMNLDPSDILYIGDREDIDSEGAKGAGMQVVILKSKFKKNHHSTKYPVIRSLNNLLNYG